MSSGSHSVCPKCKAKIGIVQQELMTASGQVSGILCYMCGYWMQMHIASQGRGSLLSTVPQR